MAAERGPRRPGLRYAVALTALLLLGWNLYAAGFDRLEARRWIVHDNYRADGSEGRRLAGLLAEVEPAGARPRLLVLGNSQLKTVKGEPRTDRRLGLGGQLAQRLPDLDVFDLTSGGQQTTESWVVLSQSSERLRPDVVVLGLGGFSMGKASIRSELAAPFAGAGPLASQLADAPPEWAALLQPVLASASAAGASKGPAEPGQTIQARLDARLADRLAGLAAWRNRTSLYDELIDRPLRRDLMGWLSREVAGTPVARTVVLTSEFDAALAAVGLTARFCAQREIPLFLVLMPYDAGREPVVYRPEDAARVRDAIAPLGGARFIDLSGALGPGHFGDYVDGSRDALHFDRAGHARLARLLAPAIAAAAAGRTTD